MDTKITLSFDQEVITKAKQYAEKNNISLSRLTEYLFRKMTDTHYYDLEDLPITDWVNQVAEGQAEYRRSKPADHKKEFYDSRK